MSDNVKEMASGFEAVKIAMTQDKNGHVLRLSIHPSDTPEDVMRDPVGQRYMVALVRVNDQDQPIPSEDGEYLKRLIQSSVMLTKSPDFQSWLCMKQYTDEVSEEAAKQYIYDTCKIESRSELKYNADARKEFDYIRESYMSWQRRKSHSVR